MTSIGTRVNNCTLDAPGYGTRAERCTVLQYGKNLIAEDSETRRRKAFYAQIATSGTWYITLTFPDFAEKEDFNLWLSRYFARVIDVYESPLMPITVTVPSRNFKKVGYPIGEITFGDNVDELVWDVILAFKSATDPTISTSYASKFLPPLRDSAAQFFYPSSSLSSDPVTTGNYDGVAETEGVSGSDPIVTVVLPGGGTLQ
jgi:hypothetical protein